MGKIRYTNSTSLQKRKKNTQTDARISHRQSNTHLEHSEMPALERRARGFRTLDFPYSAGEEDVTASEQLDHVFNQVKHSLTARRSPSAAGHLSREDEIHVRERRRQVLAAALS